MNAITIIIPYFENPGMLARQQEEWETYPTDGSVEIILVDDCSKDPAKDHLKRPKQPFRLFRMTEKVKWNQHACRNLGGTRAANPWLLMLDIDHVAPRETIERLLLMELNHTEYYNFPRVLTTGADYHPALNIFAMGRSEFCRVGYDEDYCGYYGGDDEFFLRVNRDLRRVLLGCPIKLFFKEDIEDANTQCYERKTDFDYGARAAIKRLKHRHFLEPSHATTPWEEVKL